MCTQCTASPLFFLRHLMTCGAASLTLFFFFSLSLLLLFALRGIALRHSESRTYFSRDAEGAVLYKTHHFTSDELRALLLEAGLEAVEVIVETETSSRRKNAAANFLYVVATRSTL